MNNIDSTRSNFFPNSRDNSISKSRSRAMSKALTRNDDDRIQALEQSKNDARVSINQGIKDFSRIKKAVDAAPEVDNSDKIAKLKQQIESGTYQVDYEALADKILQSEF